MKVLEKYYNKIYKHTNKLLKKIVGLDITDALRETCKLRKEIEKKCGKSIETITTDDFMKNRISYDYCRYKTINEILSVISKVALISTFREEEIEEIKK